MSEVARDTVLYQPDRGRPPSPRRNLPTVRRDSGRLSSQSDRSLDLPSPSSPPLARLTRKRAASLNTESANRALVDLSLSTSTTTGPQSLDIAREQVCLCQPDPKIPRPRNAFILYRQHYQAQVVQQHPGLANPEISKIIGEQWREQTPETKNEWKRLAEEEKSRHQRQYPDYRYQPRRAGKVVNNRPVPTSSTDDICPKCHGRYISTPSTPITPFTPSFSFRSDRLPPPFAPGAAQERPRAPLSSGMSTNRTGTPSQASHPRRPFPPSQSGNLQLGSLREHHDEDSHMLSPSPDFKRRRINDDARLRNNYVPSPTGYGPPHQRLGRPPMSAIGPGYQTDPRERRESFTGPPSAILRQQPHMGMMEPPPRPLSNGQYSRGPLTGRAQTFDESLRLPPLQTQMNDSRPRPPVMTAQPHNRDTQAKSVEAMVMTIPFVNKIKVLAKISPPLAAPGLTSPAPETRGAIIAVEGTNNDVVASVGNFLKTHLEKEAEFFLQTWPCSLRPDSPTLPHTNLTSQQSSVKESGAQEKEKEKERSGNDGDSEMTDANATVDPSHMTLKAPNTNTSNTSNPLGSETTSTPDDTAPFLDYLDTMRSWHQKSRDILKFITTTPPTQSDNTQHPGIKKPIALLPSGFSLTISDYYARSIPINDAYAPVDHWQWMATLWRGIVGPDLTIYVDSGNSLDGNGGGVGPGVDGVDVKRECGAIVVRVGGGGVVEDRTLRRLGFEVLEFVRAEQGVVGL